MKDWTIRNMETGAVQVTGITARTAEEAEEKFLRLYPDFKADEIYASEAHWND